MTKPMAKHTQRALIAADVMTERGLTLKAKARRCPTCGAPCWAGMALIGPSQGVHINYSPTTPFGEMLALSAGIRTYDIDLSLISPRTAYSIKKFPADECFVHAEHLCNGPPLPINPAWTKRFPTQAALDYPPLPPY